MSAVTQYIGFIDHIFHNFTQAKTPPDSVNENEVKRLVNELSRYSERQLRDIGICRDNIENAVRFGRDGYECDHGFSLSR